jgi:hypothetical protein
MVAYLFWLHVSVVGELWITDRHNQGLKTTYSETDAACQSIPASAIPASTLMSEVGILCEVKNGVPQRAKADKAGFGGHKPCQVGIAVQRLIYTGPLSILYIIFRWS